MQRDGAPALLHAPELSPEGLVDLVTRTRPDLCPARAVLDDLGLLHLPLAAREWLAEDLLVSPDTITGWIRREILFSPRQQEAIVEACARYALERRTPAEQHNALADRRILLVEDETLITLNVEQLLLELGCSHPTVCSSLKQAKAAVEADGWDAALVDLNLRGELAWPVVSRLMVDNVPIVLMTAYDSLSASAPQTITPTPTRLLKPIEPRLLGGLLTAMLASASNDPQAARPESGA